MRSQSGPPEGRAGGADMKMWLRAPFRYAAIPMTRAKMNVTIAALADDLLVLHGVELLHGLGQAPGPEGRHEDERHEHWRYT